MDRARVRDCNSQTVCQWRFYLDWHTVGRVVLMVSVCVCVGVGSVQPRQHFSIPVQSLSQAIRSSELISIRAASDVLLARSARHRRSAKASTVATAQHDPHLPWSTILRRTVNGCWKGAARGTGMYGHGGTGVWGAVWGQLGVWHIL